MTRLISSHSCPHHCIRLAVISLVMCLGLSACQRQEEPKPPVAASPDPASTVAVATVQPIPAVKQEPALLQPIVSHRTVKQAKCSKKCSQASATLLNFKAPDDWLNPVLDQAMLALADANMGEQASPEKTIDARMQAFVQPDPALAGLEVAPYEMQIAAELIDQWRGLLVIGLNGYYFTGGAHGSAVQRYITVDRQARRVLALADVILPEQQANLNQRLQPLFYQSFKAWVRRDDPSVNLKAYEALWPFHLSKQWRLTADGLAMAYGQYDIGPYVVGMPELIVPYAQLEGILKPEYFPVKSS